jgi:hypothetical protein
MTIKKWLTKCADDSETANYISAHTKDVSNVSFALVISYLKKMSTQKEIYPDPIALFLLLVLVSRLDYKLNGQHSSHTYN